MDLAEPRLHSKRHQLFQNKWTGTAAVGISRVQHAWSRSVSLLSFLAFVPLSVGGSGLFCSLSPHNNRVGARLKSNRHRNGVFQQPRREGTALLGKSQRHGAMSNAHDSNPE